MAAEPGWSQEAIDDVGAIADYMGRGSLYHARRVVEAILELGDKLLDHPQAGRTVPELSSPNVRERFLYSYRLIYEINDAYRYPRCDPWQAAARGD